MGDAPLVAGAEIPLEQVLTFDHKINATIFVAPGNETVAAILYEVHGETGESHAWSNNGGSVKEAVDAALEAGAWSIKILGSKGNIIDFYRLQNP